MQSFNRNNLLLIRWVQAEINYLLHTGQIANSKFLKNNSMCWSELITNGFLLKLFQYIDSSYFSKLLSFDAINHHESSLQHLLTFYWNSINSFLVQKYNKEINPIYLKKQTTFKRSVYNQSEQQNSESSTIQLVKLLFYLLVQKENAAQKQCEILNNTESVGCDKNKQTNGLNYDEQLSSVTEEECIRLSEQIGEEKVREEGNELMIKSQFLARICDLSQEVQQYLVSVIQQVQGQQFIRPLTLLNPSPSSLPCTSTPQSPTHPSNFRRIIFRQIEHLQQQNEELRIKIDQIMEENNRLECQIQQHTLEEGKMINQINDYNQEKEQLFTYLRVQNGVTISTLDEFIQLVRQLEQENQSLQSVIADVQQSNYQLQKSNALKLHSINKSAVQITHLNQQITNFKSKIKGLKQDIEYLDQIVNSDSQDEMYDPCVNNEFNVPMIKSINVDDQGEMMFRKSGDCQLRHSVGNVLKENLNFSNQKVDNNIPEDVSQKKTILRHSHLKIMSIQDCQKSLKDKSNSHYRLFLQNQQNIQPSPFDEEDYIKSDTQNISLNESQLLLRSQQQEDQKQIQLQKQKYHQQLVTNLQHLYKEIADLSAEIAQIKQSNNQYRKKNKFNDKKIKQLNALHEEFLKEFTVYQ